MTQGTLRRILILFGVALPLLFIVGTGLPVCPSASLFGIPCPGCGLTRATLAVLSGNFTDALHYHPLVFVLTPVYISLVAMAAWGYVADRRDSSVAERRVPRWLGRTLSLLGGTLIALTIGVWVARFLGAFGGPVEVETFRTWYASRAK